MVAQPAHIVDRFLADIVEQGLVVRIHRAGEHEVLPHQDAVPVAQVVDIVVLVDAAAPDAQHVHVRIGSRADDLVVDRVGDARQEAVIGDIVGALHEDGNAVEFDIKAGAFRIRRLHDAQGAQPGPDVAAVGRARGGHQITGKLI